MIPIAVAALTDDTDDVQISMDARKKMLEKQLQKDGVLTIKKKEKKPAPPPPIPIILPPPPPPPPPEEQPEPEPEVEDEQPEGIDPVCTCLCTVMCTF